MAEDSQKGAPSTQMDLFSSVAYHWPVRLRVTVETAGALLEESEWDPVIRELPTPRGSLNFQQLCSCLGVQVDKRETA